MISDFLFPDADKENSYHGGPKSLKVIGFLDRARVPFGLLLGDGAMVFQSTEGDAVSLKHTNFPTFSNFCKFKFPAKSVKLKMVEIKKEI